MEATKEGTAADTTRQPSQKEPPPPPPRPIQCVLIVQRGLFLVTRSKGKTLATGGFGVTVQTSSSSSSVEAEDDTLVDDKELQVNEETDTTPATTTSALYLFVEEVLYLHERGMVDCFEASDDIDDADKGAMDSYRLYSLLRECNVSLSAYLVYAYLVKQGFRVVRHTEQRLVLLQAMQDRFQELSAAMDDAATPTPTPTPESDSTSAVAAPTPTTGKYIHTAATDHEATTTVSLSSLSNKKPVHVKDEKLKTLRLALRQDAAESPPPQLCSTTATTATCRLAFDVYNPNSAFRKSAPGLPDFVVAATYFQEPLLFAQVQQLVTLSRGIPVRLATVSDAGAVILFGITDAGVPDIGGGQ